MDEVAASMWGFEVDVWNVSDIACFGKSVDLSQHCNRTRSHSLFSGGSDVLAVARTWLFASAAYVSTMLAPRPRVAPTTLISGVQPQYASHMQLIEEHLQYGRHVSSKNDIVIVRGVSIIIERKQDMTLKVKHPDDVARGSDCEMALR